MNYYETAYEICLKEDIISKDLNKKISSGINYCLTSNEYVRNLHNEKKYKLYTFYIKELCPLKIGQKCTLIVRTMNMELCNNFKLALLQKDNDYFVATKILYEVNKEYNKFNKILAIKTIMPAVITYKKVDKKEKIRYLDLNSYNKEFVIESINKNLARKYKQLTGEDIECDCIEDIDILNNTHSYSCNYKNGYIIGNKYLLVFKKDELSQKMAILAMGTGILEKNSLGFGVCFANNDYLYNKNKEAKHND